MSATEKAGTGNTGTGKFAAGGAPGPAKAERGTGHRASAAVRRALGTREGRIGGIIALGILLVICVGPFLAPYSPTEVGLAAPAETPSGSHWFGTDTLGRDVLSRFLHGGGTVVLLPLAGVTLAFLSGGLLGLIAAYVGGRWDIAITRTCDLILSFPSLLLMLILIAGMGASDGTVILAVWLVYLPRATLTVRAASRTVVHNDYVLAAKARGERWPWILFREVLPNASTPILADYALRVTYGIIFVATLSYLGLGAQPPSSDWGLMISESQMILLLNPFAVIVPAIGIALLSVSFNLIADSVSRTVRSGSA